jgi:hypothetical protein
MRRPMRRVLSPVHDATEFHIRHLARLAPADAQALEHGRRRGGGHQHLDLARALGPARPRPGHRVDAPQVPQALVALGPQACGLLGVGRLAGVPEAGAGLDEQIGGLVGDLLAGLGAQDLAAGLERALGRLGVARDHHQDLLVGEGLLRAGVAGVAGLAGEHVAEPRALALDQRIAVPVHRAIGQVVIDLDDRQLVALADGPAVALLEVGRRPRQIEVVDRAGAGLQVDALVRDRVGDDDVVLRRHALVLALAQAPGAGGSATDAVELAGDADAIGGRASRSR